MDRAQRTRRTRQIHCPRCGWASDHFGLLLRLEREWRHLSATEAAARAYVSSALWSMWEGGDRLPSPAAFAALVRGLGLTAAEAAPLAEAAGLRGAATRVRYAAGRPPAG